MYNVIVCIVMFAVLVSAVRDVQKYRKSAPLLGGKVRNAIRHLKNFIRNFAFFGIAATLMIANFAPLRTILTTVLDPETIAVCRGLLQFTFGSASVMFALETISISALFALGFFSVLAVFFRFYLACVLLNISEESEQHDYPFKKSYYKRVLSDQGCFLTYAKLID